MSLFHFEKIILIELSCLEDMNAYKYMHQNYLVGGARHDRFQPLHREHA